MLRGGVIVQVNTASMKVLVSVHGMGAPPRSVPAMQSASAAVLAGAAGHLVLPAHNSLLQFWDAARDCHVHSLQVCLPDSTIIVTHVEKQMYLLLSTGGMQVLMQHTTMGLSQVHSSHYFQAHCLALSLHYATNHTWQ